MSESIGTISGRLVVRVLDFVARRGHDPEALCRAAGTSRQAMAAPGVRVPYGLVDELGERAVALVDDDLFGLHLAQDVGEAFTYDAGALMMMASPSIRAGLERMVRFQRYWGDGERTRLGRVRGGLRIRYALPGPKRAFRRHADECMMAEVVVGMRFLTARALAPRIVRFRHPAPLKLGEHHALFQCPLEFGADHTELELDDALLDLELPHANAAYCAIFEHQVTTALASLPRESGTHDDVRAAARAMLSSGECTVAATARVLRTSTRTLQRRLRESGTTFADLKDAVRREMALEYLAKDLAVAEIAFLLGYAEPSAFHHAFKRWTGRTPDRARSR